MYYVLLVYSAIDDRPRDELVAWEASSEAGEAVTTMRRQGILVDRDSVRSVWSRWTEWQRDDPRWDVLIHDSSDEDPEATTQAISQWVQSVRENGQPLERRSEWWKS